MTRRTQTSRGFTLIELTLVVVILGILSAAAIPQFTRFKLRALRTEALVNLKGIAIYELAYDIEHDQFIPCGRSPRGRVGPEPMPFDPTVGGWSELEWRPDGPVRCQYLVQSPTILGARTMRAEAACDLDGDGKLDQWKIDVESVEGLDNSRMQLVQDPIAAHENRY